MVLTIIIVLLILGYLLWAGMYLYFKCLPKQKKLIKRLQKQFNQQNAQVEGFRLEKGPPRYYSEKIRKEYQPICREHNKTLAKLRQARKKRIWMIAGYVIIGVALISVAVFR